MNFNLVPSALPAHADLQTAHWTQDEQIQFSVAVRGIRATPWFQAACVGMPEIDCERIALSFAYMAFASIRRRPGREMAEDAELILDNRGMGL